MKEQFIRVSSVGERFYYSDKEMTILHREDGPAIEYVSGTKFWYYNGRLHRENGPAAEYADGSKSWYLHEERLTEEEFHARMNPVKEVTLEEVAQKFGVDVKNLRIKD